MSPHNSPFHIAVLLLAVCLALPQSLLAVGAVPELPDPGSVSVSKQDQEKLGLQAVGEVYKQMPVLPDNSPVTAYVAQLGKKLQAVIPQQNSWPFQFHVVQQKEINAFALPGGPIFVNIGTIVSADNESQLAGVMAHEIAHVYMQHSIKGAQKQGLAQGIGQVLGGVLGSVLGGTAGALAEMGANIGGGLVSMKYSREDEAQADEVGAIIMYKAGYDPRAMAQFFQKLEAEGGSGPQFMSDHPNPGNRVASVNAEVQNWPGKQFITTSKEFQKVASQARNLKAYTAQEIQQMAESGQIRNDAPAGVPASSDAATMNISWRDVAPSGRFQQFSESGISIQYPANWQAFPDQQGGGITFAPQAGVQQGSIAYGVVMNVIQAPNNTSLDDATQRLVASLTQSNAGLRTVGSAQDIRINGVTAKSVNLEGNSPIQGQRERDRLVTLFAGNGNLLSIVFVSPERDTSRLQSTYDQMLKSFRLQQ